MRTVVALLLLALWAEAEDMVVRVTVDDEPLADAGVRVQPASDEGPTFRADEFAPDARTDATGQALVQATSKDWLLVYVPGYELAVVEGGGQVVDVALRPERIFSGRVVDTEGDLIVGASVLLHTTFRRKASFPVTTGESGYFHVYGLWFDDYALRVEAPGFLASVYGGQTEENSGEEIVLTRPATIAGTITDHRGEAVAGASVSLRFVTAVTAANGSYRFTDLSPGFRYRVEFPPPWGGSAGPIVLKEGEARQGVDVVRLAPVTLKLRVVDADGQGLAGVSCKLIQPILLNYRGPTSNIEGWIELRTPPEQAGKLRLWASDRENMTVDFDPAPPGVTNDLGSVVLRTLPEIEVRVRQPDGTAPPTGEIGGVALADGIAVVKGAGRYKVAVPGYPLIAWFVESPGPVEVTLPTPRWIDGIVLDANGGAVAGAQVTGAAESVLARTDVEGRFRVGPLAEGPVQLEAHTATARSESVQVVLGEGELELILVPTEPDLLRGRVVRGVRPVPRFSVAGERFVNEQGRFEILLRRAVSDVVEITVDRKSFYFALPPKEQELVARLPGGRVWVTLEGALPGHEVELAQAGERVDSTDTEEDGRARFGDVAHGAYTASANGFQTTAFTVGGNRETLVTLRPTSLGTLAVHLPQGFPDPGVQRKTLSPGIHRNLNVGSGDYRVTLDAVRIVAGEETVVDFAPAHGGSVLVRGPPGASVELRLRLADVTLSFDAQIREDGTFRFPLLAPGSYAVRAPLWHRELEIVAGEVAVLDLGRGAHVVEDRVLLWNGKPAQGAEVDLGRADARGYVVWALTDLRGRFRFANVLPGEYSCVAQLAGYAPASGTVTVGIDGVVTDGLPLALARSAGKRVRILGLAGEPLREVWVRVDGRWQYTDELGRLLLHTVPARIDLDLDGFASLRDVEVHAGEQIRLVRGASLVVLSDPEAGPPVVRIGGRPWRRLRPGPLADDPEPGRLRLEDLPAGPVEIQLPAPPRADGEEEAPEPPEPVVLTLEPGTETIVDLRPR